MNFNLLPSLEDIALIKLAIFLWNPDDIRASMRRSSSSVLSQDLVSDREKWWELEMKVREKIPHLLLHIDLQEKLRTFVEIIGLQILPWLEYHCGVYFCTDVPNEFCWTPQGTIDCKKTAEVLIQDENIDVTSRYILACIYCLREDIEKLWNKMPENRRISFYCGGDPREVRQHKLVDFWTHIMIDPSIISLFGSSDNNPALYAFEVAAEEGIKDAAQFCLQSLTSEQSEDILFTSALRYASHIVDMESSLDITTQCMDFLCYLLSQMNEKQQMELIKCYTLSVLYCFIHWPRQPLLMEMAKRALDFLPVEHYDRLLNDIRNKMGLYRDYNYPELFGNFWRLGHDFHKNFVIDWQHNNDIIKDLFSFGDIENIKLILKSATVEQKNKFIFSDYGKQICRNFLVARKWNFLKFYVREFVYDEKLMEKFKKEFLEYFARENESIDQYVKSKTLQFCQIMNELIKKNQSVSEDENVKMSED